jgi:cytochrome c biogenesis protein ResB
MKRMGASGLITNTTAAGETLLDFTFQGTDNLPMDLIQLPVQDHTLTLEMTYYQDVKRAPGENPPVYVRAYVDKEFDRTIYDAFLPRGGELRLPGYEEYSFNFRSDTATVLEVAKDPGLGLVATFFLIMTGGFTLSLYTTFARCWAKVTPNKERPGSVDIVVAGLAEKNKVSFERDFEQLATRLRDSLGEAATRATANERPATVAEVTET